MPIFHYIGVVGSALIALLFVTDATLEKRGPLWFSTNVTGLPKPWRPRVLKSRGQSGAGAKLEPAHGEHHRIGCCR